jgi:hypothetical protein
VGAERLKEIPAALWAYVAISVVQGILALAVNWSTDLVPVLIALPFGAVLVALLLAGSRIVWSISVALGGVGLIAAPFDGTPLWITAFGVASLALLLLPSSRRYVWKPRPKRAQPPLRLESEAETDGVRANGWYVDPDDPRRMRYWREGTGWHGSAKTPRQLRQG